MSRPPLALVDSAAQLDALIAAPQPLLLTFTGSKCVICRQLAPMLAAVVNEAGDALASAKVDVEALPEIAERFAVRGLPTTMLFTAGRVSDRFSGFATAGKLRQWLSGQGVALRG